MRITNSLQNKNIYFCSYTEKTNKVTPLSGKIETLNHTTNFFRNFPTAKFVTKYMVEKFPNGTSSAEFGCSIGESIYTRLILLDEYNKNKKYKQIGYDFAKPINYAHTNFHKISKVNADESILFQKENTNLAKTFLKYFDLINQNNFNVLVKAKAEVIKNQVEFKEGNILDIKKLLKPKANGAIFFQNALYHLNRDRSLPLETLDKLFKNIHNLLPKDGIFVLGTLPSEHLYDAEFESQTELLYQENKLIRIFKNSSIHKKLMNANLEPIYYEKCSTSLPHYKYSEIYFPTVWKKINRLL